MRRTPRERPEDHAHTPFLAMWYQVRTAVADLFIPLLAGFKTAWLILFRPVGFFQAYYEGARPLEKLVTPLDPLWRTLSPEKRKPLDPAHFLLFAIFAAALVGFEFDNSRRFAAIVNELPVVEVAKQQNNRTGELFTATEQLVQRESVQQLRIFLDQDILQALLEMFVTLFTTMIFAYLFYLLVGRRLSATKSYAFWLYVIGMQFLTTAVFAVLGLFLSIPNLGLPAWLPNVSLLSIGAFLTVAWQYGFPAYYLPRLIPDLTAKRVFIATLVGRGLLTLLGWLVALGGLLVLLR